MNVVSVSAVTITSNDPERLAGFYRRCLGVPLALESHGPMKHHFEGWLGDPDRGGIHFAVLKGRSGNADVGGPAPTFRDAVGLTPERFLRVVRLQAALRTLPGATNWAHVAADLGYH